MSGGFPSLGFDPAPGDLPAAGAVARGVADTARALEEVAAILSGAADGAWRGQAAIAFRDLLSGEFRPKVDGAAQSFREASRALDGWLETMRVSQIRARTLEADHAEALRRVRSAHVSLDGIPDATPPAGTTRTPEEALVEADRVRAANAAGRAASAAAAEADRIQGQARNLLRDYEEQGRVAARRLQHAMDIAPDEPGFWSRLAEGISTVLAEVEEVADDFRDQVVRIFERLAPLLAVVGDIAGMLSTVLGLLAFVPFLQFLTLPALLLSGVALLADYSAAVGRTGGFTEALTDGDVLMSALGVGLGVGALKVGVRVVAAARAGSTATAAGGAATRMVPQALGAPIETAASYFQLARSTSYSMGEAELVWRTARFHVNAAGFVQNVAQADGTIGTIRTVAAWEFGPLGLLRRRGPVPAGRLVRRPAARRRRGAGLLRRPRPPDLAARPGGGMDRLP